VRRASRVLSGSSFETATAWPPQDEVFETVLRTSSG
jgi:hypothetical protein